jgi:hypothetical protein
MTTLEGSLKLSLASHDIPYFHDLRTFGGDLFTTWGAITSLLVLLLLPIISLYVLFSIFAALPRQPLVSLQLILFQVPRSGLLYQRISRSSNSVFHFHFYSEDTLARVFAKGLGTGIDCGSRALRRTSFLHFVWALGGFDSVATHWLLHTPLLSPVAVQNTKPRNGEMRRLHGFFQLQHFCIPVFRTPGLNGNCKVSGGGQTDEDQSERLREVVWWRNRPLERCV